MSRATSYVSHSRRNSSIRLAQKIRHTYERKLETRPRSVYLEAALINQDNSESLLILIYSFI